MKHLYFLAPFNLMSLGIQDAFVEIIHHNYQLLIQKI